MQTLLAGSANCDMRDKDIVEEEDDVIIDVAIDVQDGVNDAHVESKPAQEEVGKVDEAAGNNGEGIEGALSP